MRDSVGGTGQAWGGGPGPDSAWPRAARQFLASLLAASLWLLAAGAEPAPPRALVRLVFAGDVYFGESFVGTVGDKLRPAADTHTTSIQALRHLFGGADAVVVNLETPVTRQETSPLAGDKTYLHRGEPEATLQALQALGVTAVGLANNHVMDYGESGLADTLAALQAEGIAAFGAGAGPRQAAQPWSWRIQTTAGRLDVLVVAGYEYNRRYDATYDAYAEPGDEGVNLWTPERAAVQIRALRNACPAALIIAFPHGGDNYEWRDSKQADLHGALIAAGADLVLGHGSHMAQEIERRADRWIVHGLGNAVLNTPGRYTDRVQHPWSLVAALVAEAEEAACHLSLRLYPLLSDNQDTEYRPRPANQAETERLAELLEVRSSRLGSGLDLQPTADAWGWHFSLDLGRREVTQASARGTGGQSLQRLREASRPTPVAPPRPLRLP